MRRRVTRGHFTVLSLPGGETSVQMRTSHVHSIHRTSKMETSRRQPGVEAWRVGLHRCRGSQST